MGRSHLRVDIAVRHKLAQQACVLVENGIALIHLTEDLQRLVISFSTESKATARHTLGGHGSARLVATAECTQQPPLPARQRPPCGSSMSCFPPSHAMGHRRRAPRGQPRALPRPSYEHARTARPALLTHPVGRADAERAGSRENPRCPLPGARTIGTARGRSLDFPLGSASVCVPRPRHTPFDV